ncbi:MAG TPA: WD40 repeat domain-containing protein, partial [Saprospiraceae bacterium]|nr:WD40 repeat domain-containing protein [Saprospiraceae bacterium]
MTSKKRHQSKKFFGSILLILACNISLTGQCFDVFYNKGQRLAKEDNFENAISQFRAAARCSDITVQQRKVLDVALEEAQTGYVTSINLARKKAEKAQKEAEEQARIAKKQLIITEGNRISFLADQELATGDPKDGLALAYRAYSMVDSMLIPKVKLSFGDAVFKNYAQILDANGSSQMDVLLSDKADFALARTDTKELILWDLENAEMKKLPGVEHHVYSMAFSPDGTKIFAGLSNGNILSWTLDGQFKEELEGHEAEVSGLEFSEDGRYMLSWSRDGSVQLWDMQENKSISLAENNAPMASAFFSSNVFPVITYALDGTVSLWNHSGNLMAELKHDASIYGVDLSADGSAILTCSADGFAKLWNESGQLETIFDHKGQLVTTAKFLPGSERILTTSGEGSIRIWNTSGKVLNEETNLGKFIYHSDVNQDGHILSSLDDYSILLWNPEADHKKILRQHAGRIRVLQFSQDGKHILSGSEDGAIKIWDLKGDVVLNMRDDKHRFNKAYLSHDDKWVIGILSDGSVVITPMPSNLYQEFKNNVRSVP